MYSSQYFLSQLLLTIKNISYSRIYNSTHEITNTGKLVWLCGLHSNETELSSLAFVI